MNRTLSFYVLLLVINLTINAAHAGGRIELFHLKHRTAEEVAPIIKPLLGKDASVTGQGFKLIVRAQPETLEQVRELLAQLDSAPQRLRISVRQQQAGATGDHDIGAKGTIRSGDTRIQLSDPGPARIKLHESVEHSARNATQTINTLEGRQTFIQVGKLIPYPERSIDEFGSHRESIRYKNATTGFYVVARLHGENVTLNISTHNVGVNRHGQQSFDVQQAQTTLSGKVGEWLTVGGVQQKHVADKNSITYSSRRHDQLNSDFQVRVELIP